MQPLFCIGAALDLSTSLHYGRDDKGWENGYLIVCHPGIFIVLIALFRINAILGDPSTVLRVTVGLFKIKRTMVLGNGCSLDCHFDRRKSLIFGVEKSFLLFCGGASLDLSTALEMTSTEGMVIPHLSFQPWEIFDFFSGDFLVFYCLYMSFSVPSIVYFVYGFL